MYNCDNQAHNLEINITIKNTNWNRYLKIYEIERLIADIWDMVIAEFKP